MELWENLPGPRSASVFLAEWYEALPESSADDNLDAAFWSEMVVVRQQVNKALELAREQGTLRGSLDAEVALYAGPELAEWLRSLGEELRFVLITSEATVASLDEAPSEAYEADRFSGQCGSLWGNWGSPARLDHRISINLIF